MKDFNDRLLTACEEIRWSLTVVISCSDLFDKKDKISDVIRLSKGSAIDQLINQKRWPELFTNQDWLNFLERAQKLVLKNEDYILENAVRVAQVYLQKLQECEKNNFLTIAV